MLFGIPLSLQDTWTYPPWRVGESADRTKRKRSVDPLVRFPPVVTSDRFLHNSEWHHIIMSSSILLSSSVSLLSQALQTPRLCRRWWWWSRGVTLRMQILDVSRMCDIKDDGCSGCRKRRGTRHLRVQHNIMHFFQRQFLQDCKYDVTEYTTQTLSDSVACDING